MTYKRNLAYLKWCHHIECKRLKLGQTLIVSHFSFLSKFAFYFKILTFFFANEILVWKRMLSCIIRPNSSIHLLLGCVLALRLKKGVIPFHLVNFGRAFADPTSTKIIWTKLPFMWYQIWLGTRFGTRNSYAKLFSHLGTSLLAVNSKLAMNWQVLFLSICYIDFIIIY